jgi:alpha-tubulin suppressor-like RCC1 family protein
MDTTITSSSRNTAKTLISVDIGSVVTTLARNAFNNTLSLSAVSIGSNVSAIVGDAFSDLSPITSYTVNASNLYYSSIDGVLFNKQQTQLHIYPRAKLATSYTVPNGVTDIAIMDASYVTSPGFGKASYLTDVTLSNSITSIGDGAFDECTSLSSINIPNGVVKFGSYSFSQCRKLTSFIIPNSVKYVGSNMFTMCEGLSSINIPDSVIDIGFNTFMQCSNLTNITFGNGITEMKSGTFAYCTSLVTVTIPSSVVSFSSGITFIGCDKLASIYFLGNAPTVYGSWDTYLPLATLIYYCTDKTGFSSQYQNRTTVAIPCGSKNTNQLFGVGLDPYGELGNGPGGGSNIFLPITGNWSQARCGREHSFALSAGTNRWFSAGRNLNGQLGLGLGNTTVQTFSAVSGNWSQVACHYYGYHTMALSAGTTKLFATGYNSAGQLGLGDTVQRTTFTEVTGSNWSRIVCGNAATYALSAGTNSQWFAAGIMSTIGTGFFSASTFTQLTGDWSQIVTGSHIGYGEHTMALSAGTNNQWFGVGSNNYGQLGLGNRTNQSRFTALTGNWSQMACGGTYSMALSAGTNTLFGAGNNSEGQLGFADTAGTFNSFTALTGNWSQVVCGERWTFALSANTNRWFATGYGSWNQLGLGDSGQRTTFTEITGRNLSQIICGGFTTMALSAA